MDIGVIVRVYDCVFFFFQAEDGIRDLVRSRGLGDVYKRQLEVLLGQGGRGAAGTVGHHEVGREPDDAATVPDLSLIHI